MTIIAPAEFAPDMPDLAEATNIAFNVIPLTPKSYGPLNSLATYTTNALDADPIGMGFAEDTSLGHHIFAGTPSKIWTINGTATSWTDVSILAGYSAGDENWHFAQYKNLMIATDYDDAIQVYDMTIPATPFAVLSPAAPKARFIAVAKNFVIVANTNDPVGGANPARLWWCANGDPANWPTPGSALAQQTQSDYNDMIGPQGQITGLAPNLAGCDCAVFFERGVFRMIYAGPPDIFNFYPAFAVKGCPAPNSLVTLGNMVYFLGEDGFYAFDGNSAIPIGANKVDKWFFANVDPTAFKLIIGAPDIANKAIIWIFRTLYALDDSPDRILIYRWDIQRWSLGLIEAEWVSRVPVSNSNVVVPLVAGQLELGVIGPDEKLAYFSGPPLAAQIGTQVVQINPNSRTFVSATRPLVQTGSPSGFLLTESGRVITTESGSPLLTESGSSAGITVAISTRNTYYDAEVFGPEVPPDISGQCSVRAEGRYHRGRISISPGVWSTFAGLDVQGIRSGTR